MNALKTILAVGLILALGTAAQATDYVADANGNWTDDIWDVAGYPGSGDTAQIGSDSGAATDFQVDYDTGAGGSLNYLRMSNPGTTLTLQRDLTIGTSYLGEYGTRAGAKIIMNGHSLTLTSWENRGIGEWIIRGSAGGTFTVTGSISAETGDTLRFLPGDSVNVLWSGGENIYLTQSSGDVTGLIVDKPNNGSGFGTSTQIDLAFDSSVTAGVADWALRVMGDHVTDYTNRLTAGTITHNDPAGMSIQAWYDGTYTYVGDPDPTPIPEPATMSLLALGVVGLVARRRRRK